MRRYHLYGYHKRTPYTAIKSNQKEGRTLMVSMEMISSQLLLPFVIFKGLNLIVFSKVSMCGKSIVVLIDLRFQFVLFPVRSSPARTHSLRIALLAVPARFYCHNPLQYPSELGLPPSDPVVDIIKHQARWEI